MDAHFILEIVMFAQQHRFHDGKLELVGVVGSVVRIQIRPGVALQTTVANVQGGNVMLAFEGIELNGDSIAEQGDDGTGKSSFVLSPVPATPASQPTKPPQGSIGNTP